MRFLGCKIDLSKNPLIPRTETEFWVGKVIKQIRRVFDGRQKRDFSVLDIFAGSGCIGLAVFKACPELFERVVFADKYKNCLDQIKINLKLNSSLIRANKGYMKGRECVMVQSDVFANIKEKFDYIFANPPYVAEKLRHLVQKSVLEQEPHSALFAGPDGLFYIEKFLRQAKSRLNSSGTIFMEFSPEQRREVEKLIKKNNYKNYQFHKDQFGKYRWLMVR